jgi:hypothetical protein
MRKVAQLRAGRRHLFELQLRRSGFLLVDGAQPAPVELNAGSDLGLLEPCAASGEVMVPDLCKQPKQPSGRWCWVYSADEGAVDSLAIGVHAAAQVKSGYADRRSIRAGSSGTVFSNAQTGTITVKTTGKRGLLRHSLLRQRLREWSLN